VVVGGGRATEIYDAVRRDPEQFRKNAAPSPVSYKLLKPQAQESFSCFLSRGYGGTRKPRLNARLLAFAFYQRLQHGFEGYVSFSRAGVAVFELNPAVVEAI
jgi:hypothetical protein